MFIVRDFLIERLREMQEVKKNIKSIVLSGSDALSAREDDLFSISRDNHALLEPIDINDAAFGRDLIKRISEAAIHAEAGISSISFLSEHVLSGIWIQQEKSLRDGVQFEPMKKAFYYDLLHKNLNILDYYASVPVEIPSSVSVRALDSAKIYSTPFIKKKGSRGFVGLKQGANLIPMDHYSVEYLYRIIGFNVERNNFVKNLYYFTAFGSNEVVYLWLIDNQVYAPLSISFDDAFCQTQSVHLVGVEVKDHTDFKSVKSKVSFYYSNLNIFSMLSGSPMQISVKNCMEEFFENSIKVERLSELNTIVVEVDLSDAEKKFHDNEKEIYYNAYAASRKSPITFLIDSVKSKKIRIFSLVVIVMLKKAWNVFASSKRKK